MQTQQRFPVDMIDGMRAGFRSLRTVRAVPTGEKRPPRAGEWYLSGAIVEAYQAGRDMLEPCHIARIVRDEPTPQPDPRDHQAIPPEEEPWAPRFVRVVVPMVTSPHAVGLPEGLDGAVAVLDGGDASPYRHAAMTGRLIGETACGAVAVVVGVSGPCMIIAYSRDPRIDSGTTFSNPFAG